MAEKHVTIDLKPNFFSLSQPNELIVDRFQLQVDGRDAGRLDMLAIPDLNAVVVSFLEVEPSDRGNGYGSLLLSRFEQYITNHNLTGILMNAIPTYSPQELRTMYERRRWQAIKGYPEWYSFNAMNMDQQTLNQLVETTTLLLSDG